MAVSMSTVPAAAQAASGLTQSAWRPRTARVVFLVVVATAAVAGALATDAETASRAAANAGDDLTRLLRAMAVIKTVMAAGAAAAIFWRLGASAGPIWWTAYALACAAMAAAPGLIWSMAHAGLGALLLHGGLLAAVLLLWRDPVVGERLAGLVASRRAALRRG